MLDLTIKSLSITLAYLIDQNYFNIFQLVTPISNAHLFDYKEQISMKWYRLLNYFYKKM